MLQSLGVSYKKASLATLDALTLRNVPEFYNILRAIPGVAGSLILQTCNRVEIFLEIKDTNVQDRVLWNWALETKFKLGELKRLVEMREGNRLLDYLVRLASGLESMLVGESQILGQLKTALAQARSLGTPGTTLSEAFERAISAGSRIREETGIGRGTVGLGSAALRLAEDSLGSLDGARVLLIGTGQVGMLLMKALKNRGIADVMVAGRTRQRTESFCRAYGGTPTDLQGIPGHFEEAKLVMVATRASGYLLSKETVASRRGHRRGSGLMIIDFSNPRNVSPDVGELDGVILKTMGDLQGIADEALAKRKELVEEADPLVRETVDRISSLLRREEAEPIVSDIYKRANEIRAGEMGKALSKLKLTPDERQVLENMSISLVEKLLDQPVINLRRAAEKGDTRLLNAAGQIFERG